MDEDDKSPETVRENPNDLKVSEKSPTNMHKQ